MRRVLAALGARLFAQDDRAAVQHGWEISRRRAGLARTYRDPRFDTLQACAQCGGRGVIEDGPCTPCRGTGRVTLRAAQVEGRGP